MAAEGGFNRANSVTIRELIEDKGTDVSTVSPDQQAVDAAKIMAEERIGVLVCCFDPTVVSGVISERDIVRAFAEQPDRTAELLVAELMTKDVEVCGPNDDLRAVLTTMKRGKFRHIPVVEDGRLRGLVSVTDILLYYVKNAHLDDRQTIIDMMFKTGLIYPGG